MFSIHDRDRVRDHVLERASADPRVVADDGVGSLALDVGDRWSDLDLTFAVADNVPVPEVLEDWTRDLVRLQELPAKKCILNPDGMTDMKKFKKLAGDRMAMMGDVPASMLAAGTPEDVRKYVR